MDEYIGESSSSYAHPPQPLGVSEIENADEQPHEQEGQHYGWSNTSGYFDPRFSVSSDIPMVPLGWRSSSRRPSASDIEREHIRAQEVENQHIGTSPPLIPDGEEPQGQAQGPEPVSLTPRDIAIFRFVASILGVLIGYESAVTGGVVIGTEFTVKLFTVLIRGKTVHLEDNYCAYLTPDFRFFGCLLQLFGLLAASGLVFARMKLTRWSFKKMLLGESVVHVLGAVIIAVWGGKRKMLFIGRVVQAIGYGLLSQAADVFVHILPDEYKDKIESVHIWSKLLGPVVAVTFNMILGLGKAPSFWRISFPASLFLSLLLLLASIPMDGNAGKTIGQADMNNAWLLLRKREQRPQLVVEIIRTMIIPLTDLNLYSTVLVMYFVPNLQTGFIAPFVLGLADVAAKVISIFWLHRHRQLAIGWSSGIASLMQICVGILLHYAPQGGRSKQIKRGQSIGALTLLSAFWVFRAIFSHWSGWLRHGSGNGVVIALSAITQVLDMFVQFAVALLAPYAVCFFGSNVFYVMGALLYAVTIFIIVGVPETAHLTTKEEEQTLIRSHRIWKCI